MTEALTAQPMPADEDALLYWVEAIIAEVTLCNMAEVDAYSERDLLDVLTTEERQQWQAIPASVRLPLLFQARDQLFDRLAEEAFEDSLYR